jgi:hypothetical protein
MLYNLAMTNQNLTLNVLPSAAVAGSRNASVGLLQLLIVIAFLMIATPISARGVVHDTFDNIQNTPAERLVLFYFSSDPRAAETLDIFETVASVSLCAYVCVSCVCLYVVYALLLINNVSYSLFLLYNV